MNLSGVVMEKMIFLLIGFIIIIIILLFFKTRRARSIIKLKLEILDCIKGVEETEKRLPTLEIEKALESGKSTVAFGKNIDENVQFTVFRPKTVQPKKWYSLLAFAHLSDRRPNAEPDEPDPIKEVQR